jgi:hypothetical protein
LADVSCWPANSHKHWTRRPWPATASAASAIWPAWQLSGNWLGWRPGHDIALLVGRADAGWLLSPDFIGNMDLVELRYLWTLTRPRPSRCAGVDAKSCCHAPISRRRASTATTTCALHLQIPTGPARRPFRRN